jgi:hypothetical protein
MRFELIGFGTIEFEDRTLMVARARPQGQQPKITPLPVSSAVSMLPRLVAFVLHGYPRVRRMFSS